MMKPNDVVLNKLLNAKVIGEKDVVTAKKLNKAIFYTLWLFCFLFLYIVSYMYFAIFVLLLSIFLLLWVIDY